MRLEVGSWSVNTVYSVCVCRSRFGELLECRHLIAIHTVSCEVFKQPWESKGAYNDELLP